MSVPVETVAQRALNVVPGQKISCNFSAYNSDDVKVVYGAAALVAEPGSDYTVALSTDFKSFTVTVNSALVAKIDALIALDATEVDEVVVRRSSTFVSAIETDTARLATFMRDEINRIVTWVQELKERTQRGVFLSDKNVGASALVLNGISAGKVLQFNSAGTGIEATVDGDTIAAAEANANTASAAAASATAALDSILGNTPIENVDTIADVQALDVAFQAPAIDALGHTSRGDLGGGRFVYDAGDASTADDGVMTLVDTIGRRWKRQIDRYGLIPQNFGCFANGLVQAGKLKEAFEYCAANQIPLWLMSTGETAGGGVCRYRSDVSLPLGDNLIVRGPGRPSVEIRFDSADVNGLTANEASDGIVANFELSGFTIRGRAPTSPSATVTVGLDLRRCRDFKIDIGNEDFVDLMQIDPGDVGFIEGVIRGVWFHNKFPNPNNGFPRRGAWLRVTGTKKAQTLDMSGLKMYSSISTTHFTGTVPAGKAVDLTIKAPLYRYEGMRVFTQDDGVGEYGARTLNSDYTLLDMTAGEPGVEISPAWVNPGDPSVADVTTPVLLRVEFGAGWAEGDTYSIRHNDAWAETAMLIEGGSGIYAPAMAVGGYRELLDAEDLTDSLIGFKYAQLSDLVGKIRGGCSRLSVPILEINGTVNQMFDVSAGATKIRVNQDSGDFEELEFDDDTYVGSTFQTLQAGAADGYVTVTPLYPSWRKIEVELHIIPDDTVGDDLDIVVDVIKSKNNGAFAAIKEVREGVPDDTVSDRLIVKFDVIDKEVGGFVSGVSDRFRYGVQVRGTNAADEIQIVSSSIFESKIRVTELEPYLKV